MKVGRRRTKDLQLPAGVRPIGERLFWQPTTKRERLERKAQKLPASVRLGRSFDRAVGSSSPSRSALRWAEVSGLREPQTSRARWASCSRSSRRAHPDAPQRQAPRSANTVKQYRYRLPHLRARFGAARSAGLLTRWRAAAA
jgi:hypothetical protein